MGWQEDAQMLSRLNLILGKEQLILSAVNKIDISGLKSEISALSSATASLTSAVEALTQSQTTYCTQLNIKLDKLLALFIPPPIAGFSVTVKLRP